MMHTLIGRHAPSLSDLSELAAPAAPTKPAPAKPAPTKPEPDVKPAPRIPDPEPRPQVRPIPVHNPGPQRVRRRDSGREVTRPDLSRTV
jgi:hypothetical protein